MIFYAWNDFFYLEKLNDWQNLREALVDFRTTSEQSNWNTKKKIIQITIIFKIISVFFKDMIDQNEVVCQQCQYFTFFEKFKKVYYIPKICQNYVCNFARIIETEMIHVIFNFWVFHFLFTFIYNWHNFILNFRFCKSRWTSNWNYLATWKTNLAVLLPSERFTCCPCPVSQ